MKQIIRSCANAWEMLLELPLPEKVTSWLADEENETSDNENGEMITQLCFPVVAMLLSLFCIIIAALLSNLHRVSAALIFAFVLTLLSELRDKGRGSGTLSSLVILKVNGHTLPQAMFNLTSDLRTIEGAVGAATLTMMIILRFLAFFLCSFYNFSFWLIPVLVLNYTIQADLATFPNINSGEPFLEVDARQHFYVWTVAAFFCCFVLFKAPILTLIALGGSFLFAIAVKRFVEQSLGGVTGNVITLAGYITEITVLTLGVIGLSG